MKLFLIFFIIIISGAGYFAVQKASSPKETQVAKGNALDKYSFIRANSPQSNAVIENPVLVEGKARGTWFFEASFPVRVVDSAGKELGVGIARALSDWMTQDFVPFQVQVRFQKSSTKTGFVVLEKDNPSGLKENADELRIPVRFAE
jgi:hypothetical protein